MDKESIVALRRELSCTRRELAATLDLEPKLVDSWENGELFPTKKAIAALEALRQKGPGGVKRRAGELQHQSGLALLEDPRLWTVVRRLVEDPQLLAQVLELVDKHQAQP